MAWLKKKHDPLSTRARALNDEIAHLEAEIKRLDAQLQREQSQAPAQPPTAPVADSSVRPRSSTRRPSDPVFEEMDKGRLQTHGDTPARSEIYNDLGVRKFDLPAMWGRFCAHFRGPAASNPKLVSYLAAGGIQGLRPLRYEKRVARNRFISLVALIFIIILGAIWEFFKAKR